MRNHRNGSENEMNFHRTGSYRMIFRESDEISEPDA